MSIDSLGTHFNGSVAQEINRWIPKDEVPELTALASAVIKQAVKDDIKDGIDMNAYNYDERIVGNLWWGIISKSARLDVADIKNMVVREAFTKAS
tara:strand:- start:347 stop:631 length:285 start_codon:yes stop_codon:yes gene_type:complete